MRIILWIDALLFFAFGALYVVIPERMAAQVGIQMTSPGAMIDVQGLYGGLELGLGLFLGLAALRPALLRAGLLAGSFALSGIALVRILAALRLGSPDSAVLSLLVLDSFGAVMNLWALRRFASINGANRKET